MPPSIKRNQRGRRDIHDDNDSNSGPDADIQESSSPTRPAKRRRGPRSSDQSDASPRGVASASTSHTVEGDSSSVLTDDQLVALLTQQLKSRAVQASKDHSNTIHEANGDGVKAYAKIAAQDWTYYITKLNVNIGRAPEASHGNGMDTHEDLIHIDLGPSKMVSREHGSISFDSKDEKWVLLVKGRNGLKVNGHLLKQHALHPLTSGEVIEIGNVEMIFVLPSELGRLHIHDSYLQRCGMNSDVLQAPAIKLQPRFTLTATEQKQPGTPTSAHRQNPQQNTLKSPLLASTPSRLVGPSNLDLSHDDNQHMKPQYSYAQLITQAILNAPDGKLNLNGIYTFIMNTYSYYRHQQAAGWQNSIRHNLSLNKAFDKVARSTDEPGKGMKWQIVPEAREEMIRNAFKLGRGGHRGSSAPSSPNQLNYITHGPKDVIAKDSPTSRRRASPLASPPPRSSVRAVQSTPDRKSDRPGYRSAMLTADGSPLPRQRKPIAVDSSLSNFQPQSPTLTSSYLQDEGASFVTPAPPRVHPKLAPPSTAQRPSQHMPTSSPAPFWKYADIGSTPLKPCAPYEISPSKVGGAIPPQSSSPPSAGKSPPSSPSRPQKSTHEELNILDEAEEEQGFDLMKGFQSIGAYHAPVSRGVSVATALKGKS